MHTTRAVTHAGACKHTIHSKQKTVYKKKNISYFVDRASLYNLVNKANLAHNLFLEYLF